MDVFELSQAFLIAFSAVFLMEMGDKTQLTAFTLSVKYRSPVKVFLGVIAGLSGVTLIAVGIGLFIRETVDVEFIKPGIALLFILGGLFILIQEIRSKQDQSRRICPVSLNLCHKPRENCPEIDFCGIFKSEVIQKGAFIKSLTLMFFAELGDKTMLMGAGLVTQFDPLGVFMGALAALTVVNGLGVFLGEKVANKVPKRQLGLLSGFLFIGTGILVVLL
ncbi:MAG: TMEM165/GDT1 family protein [Candidatus Hodarchaeales archaeon]